MRVSCGAPLASLLGHRICGSGHRDRWLLPGARRYVRGGEHDVAGSARTAGAALAVMADDQRRRSACQGVVALAGEPL